MPQVYIAHGNYEYSNLFVNLGFQLCDEAGAADLICFTGGADVSPSFYGDVKHRTTHNDLWRDEQEKHLFETGKEYKIPMVGICRGGQFLNVMNGGNMYQDVSGHTRSHYIKDKRTGEIVYVSSTHHQMMMPYNMDKESYSVLATTNNLLSYDYVGLTKGEKNLVRTNLEPEVVYFKEINAIAIQSHPEWQRGHLFVDWLHEQMANLFKWSFK